MFFTLLKILIFRAYINLFSNIILYYRVFIYIYMDFIPFIVIITCMFEKRNIIYGVSLLWYSNIIPTLCCIVIIILALESPQTIMRNECFILKNIGYEFEKNLF